ncbi:hypothetical protein LQW54_003174 [Pestalotiopsis sp. IQ-011]
MDDAMDPAADTTPFALRLPTELLKKISDELPNKDIKQLRLTCRTWAHSLVPRTPRVILSANPRNVDVFNAIASHESFRHQVKEVIWDEGILYDDLTMSQTLRDPRPWLIQELEEVPAWFRDGCRNDSMRWGGWDDEVDTTQLSRRMPTAEAWAYYTELLEQQRQVLASKAHIRAFEKHIGSFPALRRITINPATCGMLFNPLYESPMVRAFPSGFIGPLSRSWQNRYKQLGIDQLKWDLRASRVEGPPNWQGIRTIARVLSEGRDGGIVTDLHIETRRLGAGLTLMRFSEECHETLEHFVALLARPGIKHLHLELAVNGTPRQSKLFRRSLGNAAAGKALEHLHIGTKDPASNYPFLLNREAYIRLDTFFDPSQFSRLRHFGLSHFDVDCFGLWRFLDALPETLRSVELSMVHFMHNQGNFRLFLQEMRDQSGWPARDPKPTLRIYLPDTLTAGHRGIRQVRLDDELTEFLYEGGVNPFQGDDGNQILRGCGMIEDVFDAQYKKKPLSVEYVVQND